MENEQQRQKRKQCDSCGETFSHSGYYTHVSSCHGPRLGQRNKQETESDSDSFVMDSDVDSHSSSSTLKLDSASDEGLDMAHTLSVNHSGQHML